MEAHTRFWYSESSNTALQFRTDTQPMVYLHTNIGWLPLGNTPRQEDEAEAFAESIAGSYSLVEAPQSVAHEMLGSGE